MHVHMSPFADNEELAVPAAAAATATTEDKLAMPLQPQHSSSPAAAGIAECLQPAADQASFLQQQQQQQLQQQQQQQLQQQQQAVPWPSDVQLHVYWDLDNLKPSEWLELPALIE
jgi:hypothetical protein